MTHRDGDRVAGRYLVAETLGRHPAFTAYRVADTEAEVDVELWIVARALVPGAADRAAFGHAATAARELTHANARRVFDAGELDDTMYVSVQLATGAPLPERMAVGRPLPDAAWLGHAVGICDALAAAHALGLVHGHLIPDDVVEVSGAVKLGGVGLWGGAPREAVQRAWGESLRYVAPEARLGEIAPAADSYSIAAILLELAVGADARWRIEGDVGALCERVAQERPDLPLELRHAVLEDPARRPSVAALGAALRRAQQDDNAATGTVTRVALPGSEPPARPETVTVVVTGKGDREPPEQADAIDLVTPPPTPVPSFGADVGRKLPLEAEPSRQFVRPAGLAEDDGAAEPTALDPADAQGRDRWANESPTAAPARDAASPAHASGERALTRAPTVPRIGTGLKPPRRRVDRIAIAAAAAAAAGLAVWVVLWAVYDEGAAPEPVDTKVAVPPRPPAVVPLVAELEPCPEHMALIDRGGLRFCIDRYESPGKGQMPAVSLARAEAQARCEERLARLCTPEEWELACRGAAQGSFPYGEAYRREVCNADLGRDGAVERAGSYPECVTSDGVLDLSGNVAEWVADGRPRGGSALLGDDGRCSRRRRVIDPGGDDDVGFRCCRQAARPSKGAVRR